MATLPPKSLAVKFAQFVVQANATAVSVPVIAGNTTVNSTVNATSIVVQSATSNTQLTANGLTVGTAVVNSSVISAPSIFVGNSSINTSITSNTITWNTLGVGAPTTTTRSAGTKLVLSPAVAIDKVDYAIGIDTGILWNSVSSTAQGFKWYANTFTVMTANVVGLTLPNALTVGNSTVYSQFTQVSTILQANATNVGMTIASNGNVGINTSIPGSKLVVNGAMTTVDLTVSGNLTVSGTTTYVNSTNLNVGDNIVSLNADVTNVTAPSENAGISVNRGSSANVAILWDESIDKWTLTNDGTTYANIVVGAASGGGATLVANTTDTQTFYLPLSNATSGSWTNGVVDTTLSYVPSSHTMTIGGTGKMVVGNTTSNIVINSTSISINGSVGANAQVLTSNGTATYWANAAAGGGGGGSGTTTNALTIGNGLASANGDVLSTWLPIDGQNDGLGSAVATNGTYTVVSAREGNYGAGYVNVYLNSTGALQYRITISGTSLFGAAVAINDFNFIAVSDTAYGGSVGRVLVFDMSTWSTYSGSMISITSASQTIYNPTSNSYYFGNALAFNTGWLVVGCSNTPVSGYSSAGAVYLYQSGTTTLKYKITNPNMYGSLSDDGFGRSVAISNNTLVVGAYAEGNSTQSVNGAVYVFDINLLPTYISTTQNITSSNYTTYGGRGIAVPDPETYVSSYMGWSVATNGTYVVAGAPYAKGAPRPGGTTRQEIGAVYVFNVSNGALVRKITAPNPITNGGQNFGYSVSMSGNDILVGEPYDGAIGQGWHYPGVAYIFDAVSGRLKKTYHSPNIVGSEGGAADDRFGLAVGLSGSYAVISSPYEVSSTAGGRGGVAFLFNATTTFNGSAAATVSLAKTSVVPGLYGYTDGSSYIDVPSMVIDSYGRVVSVTNTQFTPTSGISSAFTSVKAAGQSLAASGTDMFEIAAGNNVTISANTMTKVITISSTGGSAGGGAGGGASVPFIGKIGPAAISYQNADATFTATATGRLLVEAIAYGDNIITVGGPGLGGFSQLNSPYTQLYGPNGPGYPYISNQSIQSGATVHVILQGMNSMSGTVDVLAYTLDSTTDPNSMQVYRGNSSGYSYGGPGSMSIQPVPMQNGVYMYNPNYFYGIVYLQGGGGGGASLSSFQPANGVTHYYDTNISMLFVKIPGMIWANGGEFGTVSGFMGGYGLMGYFFG